MKKKRVFSADEKMQIIREAEEFGTTATCRKYDLASSLFYKWKSQFIKINASLLKGSRNSSLRTRPLNPSNPFRRSVPGPYR